MKLREHLQNPLFRALFSQTGEAVMIASSRDRRIIEANPKALSLLEYTIGELRGLTVTDLSPVQQQHFVDSYVNGTIQGAGSEFLTTRLQSKSGENVPCELSMCAIENVDEGFLLFTFNDISERIRAMEDIELRNIAIANVTSGVTVADARQPDLPLIYVNQGFQDITGYSAREAVGRSCRFLQGDDRDQIPLDELREALRSGEPCVVQLRNYRKDGTLFYNELHISPVRNEDGELTHFVGIQLDVTNQVKARESLERSEEQTRLALERERELNEIKTRFISMVSHEFRTPMTGIRSSAALLQRFGEKLDAEKRQRHLMNIESSLKRMNRLLDDVLFFSRAEARKLQVERKPLCIRTYMLKFIESVSPIYPDRDINFDNQLAGDTTYNLDEHLLDHIFHNLVGNALKYSPVDTTVDCRITETPENLLVAITDHGIGIPKEDQQKLFEAFHRAGNVGTRQGTGLGLNIALHAVELLGGTLTFKSEQDKGSTFLVSLPKSTTTNHTNNEHHPDT